MALSMFLRSKACIAPLRHLQRLSMQPAVVQRTLSSQLLASTVSLKTLPLKTTTPILDSVCSFRTTAVRSASDKPHDHATIWILEKGVSALLIPLIPLAFFMPCKQFDYALAVLITAHSFWGLEAIAVDYARAAWFGPVVPKLAIGLVYAISIATLGGLFYLISHDVGLANAVRQLWAAKSGNSA